jgi:hypothetical protein
MAAMIDWGSVLGLNNTTLQASQAATYPGPVANAPAYQPQNTALLAPPPQQQSIPLFAPPPEQPQDTSILADIWDWAKSDTGSNIIAGVASGLFSEYQQGKILDANDKYRQDQLALERERLAIMRAQAARPTAAELQHKRVAAHNASINKPMDMGVKTLKR